MARLVALRCTISRGGFSDERIFRLRLPGGDYTGIASRTYCWNDQDDPLSEGEPAEGQTIAGKVAARVLEVRGADVLVSIPDGDVVTVRANQLIESPPLMDTHVSIRS